MTSSLPIRKELLFNKKNRAFRGLKITWECIANSFISCSIILSFKLKKIVHFGYFQNTFPFVSTFRQTDFIQNKRRNFFVEQGIGLYPVPRIFFDVFLE